MKLKTILTSMLSGLEVSSREVGDISRCKSIGGSLQFTSVDCTNDPGRSRLLRILTWGFARGLVPEPPVLYLGRPVLPGKLHRCAHCASPVSLQDSTRVFTDWSNEETENWCRSCIQSYTRPRRGASRFTDLVFRCFHTNAYYTLADHTVFRVEGELCCEDASIDDAYYWESDEEYHWEEEPEPEAGCIAGYHDSPRPWRNLDTRELLYGVELEILACDSSTRYDIYEKAVSLRMLGEEDGSLHESRGIEIIGPPMSYSDTAAEDRCWMKFLNWVKGKAVGWDAGTGYGMHVNINRRALTPLEQAKLVVFIHGNRSLCEKLAGREQSTYAMFQPRSVRIGTARQDTTDKYYAVSLRGRERMEVRFFRSSIVPSTFLRNVQFVDSIVKFCGVASARELAEKHYKAWLKTERKRFKLVHDFLFEVTPPVIPPGITPRASKKKNKTKTA